MVSKTPYFIFHKNKKLELYEKQGPAGAMDYLYGPVGVINPKENQLVYFSHHIKLESFKD